MTAYCCYKDCTSICRTFSSITFFNLPNDHRREIWLQNTGEKQLLTEPIMGRKLFCEKHFDPKYLRRQFNRTTLHRDAVPIPYGLSSEIKECAVTKYDEEKCSEIAEQTQNAPKLPSLKPKTCSIALSIVKATDTKPVLKSDLNEDVILQKLDHDWNKTHDENDSGNEINPPVEIVEPELDTPAQPSMKDKPFELPEIFELVNILEITDVDPETSNESREEEEEEEKSTKIKRPYDTKSVDQNEPVVLNKKRRVLDEHEELESCELVPVYCKTNNSEINKRTQSNQTSSTAITTSKPKQMPTKRTQINRSGNEIAPVNCQIPNEAVESNNEETYFALSLVGILKRLSPRKRAIAKCHILSYLTELEYGPVNDLS